MKLFWQDLIEDQRTNWPSFQLPTWEADLVSQFISKKFIDSK